MFTRAFILLCFITLGSAISHAQTKSNKGTEFWLGYMKHIEGTRAGMSLYITSDSNTTGTVTIPGQSWSKNFTVTANSLTVVELDVSKAYMSCSDCKESRAVKVVSDKNIIVYSHHYEGNKSDATLVLPSRTLGKDYYLVSHQESTSGGNGEFIIVANKDNTKVNITPKHAISKNGGGTRPAGTTYQITLNTGEVYQAVANSGSTGQDLTGTHIEVIDTGATSNCRRVAVFAGSTYTRINTGCDRTGRSGDNLYEQMFPTNSWGSRFVLVPALGRVGDNFKILAATNSTEIYIFKTFGTPDIITLNEGDSYSLTDEEDVRYVLSNNPICVAQFQRTSSCDSRWNSTGDPSMTILNPLEQTLKNITVYSSSDYDIDNHYINVVIPSHAAASFKLDGVSQSFSYVPRNSNYSYGRFSVSSGNHRLTANEGFIATAYGEGRYESYGYAAGANVKDLTAQATVANSPQNNLVTACLGRAVQFNGEAEYNVVKWEWDFGDGNTSSLQNPSHLYSDTGVYTARLYTYKPAFDGCSSYDSAFVDVHVFATPELKISYGPLCDSSHITFTEISDIPDPENHLVTYWNFNNEPTIYSRSTTQLFDTVGKIPFRVEVSTANQCKDTIQDTLIINPVPIADFTAPDACFGDFTLTTNTSTIATGTIDSSIWTYNSGTSSDTAFEVKHFFNTTGYQYIDLTVISDSGCRSVTYTDSIYKHPQMNVSFLAADNCVGSNTSLTNTSTLAGGSFTDTMWTTSSPDTMHTWDYSHQFDTENTYTVKLVMEQDSFCKDSFTADIHVDPYVVPDFDFENVCLGDSLILIDKSTLSAGTYTIEWLWDGADLSGDSVRIKYASGGVKYVNIKTTTDKGCESDSSKQLTIFTPSINQMNVNNICEGLSQEISSTNTLGLDSFQNYNWTINGTTVSTDSSFNHTALGFDKKIVELNVITKNGCNVSIIDSFDTYIVPKTNFFVTSVCDKVDITPIDNSTIVAPATISSYNWYIDDTRVSSDQNPNIGSVGAGNFDVKLVTTSGDGCADSVQKVLVVHPLPVPSFDASMLCLGDQTRLESSATIAGGNIVSTEWEIDGTNTSGNNVNYTFSSAGDYTITQILTSNHTPACKDTLEQVITINPLPTMDVNLDLYEGCVPFEIAINNNSNIGSGSITNYEWSWGDGNTSSGDITSYTYNDIGSYNIKVKGTSDYGCTDSMDLNSAVTVYANPVADFAYLPTDISTLTEFVEFRDSSSDDVTQWEWSITDGSWLSGKNVKHSFQDSGTYIVTLSVTNDNGCIDEESKTVYVDADLLVHIPTSFSPNGDEINDVYQLGGLTQGVVDMKLQVYNRWGEMIFESLDVNDAWDGTYNGKPVKQGVYIYMLQFTNPKQSKWYYFNGEITLLR